MICVNVLPDLESTCRCPHTLPFSDGFPAGALKRDNAVQTPNTEHIMTGVEIPLTPLIALIAGIAILIVPKLLNYIIAAYLILIGILGLI